jgi:hypothetical protein
MTKRYHWCKQKASIEKGQTILWPKDTNGVIRSLQLKRDRQYYDQKIVCPFSIQGLWLPHWYHLVIVLSVPFQLKASDYPLVSLNAMPKRYQWGKQKASIETGQTILWPKDTNGIIRSLQLKRDRQYYDQKIPMGNQKPSLLITLLVSFGHSIVCPFSIQDLWLPHWYHLVIVLFVPFQLKPSVYLIGIFWME